MRHKAAARQAMVVQASAAAFVEAPARGPHVAAPPTAPPSYELPGDGGDPWTDPKWTALKWTVYR